MRVLVAPDKFKGTLTAAEVGDHLAYGLAEVGADTVILPLADGGDGSVAAAVASGMTEFRCTVEGATGRRHPASIAYDGETAVVEVANTCGLSTLPHGHLAPLEATSVGFGQAVRYAADLGARTIVLALGGSASTDGGAGALAALGYIFRDKSGRAVRPSGRTLTKIHSVEVAHPLRGVDVVAAGDVSSPLIGNLGAAAIFGPQKGATLSAIDHLEHGLDCLVKAFARSGHSEALNWAVTPGAGAAGGLGFAALALRGRITSGADYILDLLGFDEKVCGADLVVTGEGRLDAQTLTGKLPAVVARRASPVPTVAVVGKNELTSGATCFAGVVAVSDVSTFDTTHDPAATAQTLRRIGTDIGLPRPRSRVRLDVGARQP